MGKILTLNAYQLHFPYQNWILFVPALFMSSFCLIDIHDKLLDFKVGMILESLLRAFLEPSCSLLSAFFQPSWSLLGAFLEPSWSLLGTFSAFLEPSWSLLGAFLEPSWSLLGAFLKPSCRLYELYNNLKKNIIVTCYPVIKK